MLVRVFEDSSFADDGPTSSVDAGEALRHRLEEDVRVVRMLVRIAAALRMAVQVMLRPSTRSVRRIGVDVEHAGFL